MPTKAERTLIGRTVLKSIGRGSGWMPDVGNYSQDRRLAEKLDTRTIAPESPCLDPEFYPAIRDQGELGSCTGHGTVASLEYHLLKRDKAKWSKYPLSPLYAYYRARERINMLTVDSGAQIRDAVWGAASFGVTTEAKMPYDVRRFSNPPTKAADVGARWHQAIAYHRCDEPSRSHEHTIDNVLRALASGAPVVFGFPCYDNLGEANDTGYIPPPGPNSRLEGGHCMCIFGADTRQKVFYGPNSWSSSWGAEIPGRPGERGFFLLPFSFFLSGDADDAWSIFHE